MISFCSQKRIEFDFEWELNWPGFMLVDPKGAIFKFC